MADSAPAPVKVIRRKTVEEKIGIKTSCLYGKLKHNPKRPNEFDPTFPKPIRLGAKAVGWFESEIDAWLNSRRNERTHGA